MSSINSITYCFQFCGKDPIDMEDTPAYMVQTGLNPEDIESKSRISWTGSFTGQKEEAEFQ